jgi:hypothetical protein
MGEVIRKTAAADDIIADLRATLTNARAKGGAWKTLAENQLAATATLVDGIETRSGEAEKELAPVVAELEAKDADADRLLGRVSDEIWNEVGRPATDPVLSILFPGGIAYYADASVDVQPDRMNLLAELIESNIHPRLSPVSAKGHAKDVRASAKGLRAAVDAGREPAARVELLRRMQRAVATTAQVELTNLKRLYKIERFSEADIHAVIPDRPAPSRKVAPPAPAPPTGGGAGGAATPAGSGSG